LSERFGAVEFLAHHELVVVIRFKVYFKLPSDERDAINFAWADLMHGREIEKKVEGADEALFLVTVIDEKQANTAVSEEPLSELLQETGVGCLTTDPYEVELARRLPNFSCREDLISRIGMREPPSES
jgi:hypothetical protein